MERTWLQQYPAGVPTDIDPGEYASLRDLFDEAVATHGNKPAYANMGATLTFAQLDALSKAFAAWLQKKSGLVAGDRVALMMPNVLQYPIALFGTLRAGMVVVNTNPLYTARELEHQLKDSGAKCIVIVENFAHVLQQVLPRTVLKKVLVTRIGDLLGFPRGLIVNFVLRHIRKQIPEWSMPGAMTFKSALSSGLGLKLEPPSLGPDDIAFLQYTGGTTGIAKAAVLTHRNMVANVLQTTAWIYPAMQGGGARIIVTALPLYHIFALTTNCLAFLPFGACNVLITNPRDFPGFVAELKKYKFNFISGVNTLFNALLHTPGFETVDFRSLRVSFAGGMAVQGIVAERWKKVTGCVLTQGWGLTETAPVATANPIGADFNGSIGLPISSTDVSIRDDDGKEVGANAVGEICVFGPQVMRGYWNRPDETEQVMFGDWLRTGDIGRINSAGFVFLEDRKKDMILVSGFNVYPNEVEAVAVQHPGVLEVAAVAQADEASGEVVALFVVKKDPSLTAQSLIAHCRIELTGYKVPKHVYFRSELPKTNVGKILRRALRDELRAASGRAANTAPDTVVRRS
ncbi:MAG: long-chain fatty acid--CoA ligase [Gammaproteobacteria bacterium]|nr:long-chain fatty acid--CoA ligase [Gammaproteobacteria bacterium]